MAKPLLIKTMKRIIIGLIGVLVLAGMFWYINTYIYEFYASTPTLQIDISEKSSVKVGEEFFVVIGFPKNVESLDIVLTYDKDKLTYLDSVTSAPANYFKAPQKVSPASNTDLRLIFLANDNVARTDSVSISLKFKATKTGNAHISVDPTTVIAGVENNNAVNYNGDFSKASKPISILADSTPSKAPTSPKIPSPSVKPSTIVNPTSSTNPSPSVNPSSGPTPTPPWQNPNYNTTTVYGIVQTTTASGEGIAGEYWRKDNSVCANADYNNAPNMNVNSLYLDQCAGFNNIPYFLTVLKEPGNAISYQLNGLPQGYQCVGWEHRLRIKSSGQPSTVGEGTGCNTAQLNITVNDANSTFENSHFILFKIRQVNAPSPTSSLDQFESVLNMKIRFQGIPEAPREQYRKLNARVTLKGGGQEVKSEVVEFTAQEDATWTGSMGVDGLNTATQYEVLVKGAKHLAKRICVSNPSEQLGGTYRCDEPNISLQDGSNELDFSGIILLGGDLPQQDGLINALDFAFIRQNLGSQVPEYLIRGDLNLDGIIDTQDHTIIKTALDFKYDEE